MIDSHLLFTLLVSLGPITSSSIESSENSQFLDHSNFGYVLLGYSRGGEPTTFSWRKHGIDVSSLLGYTILDPEESISDYMGEIPCSERIYVSKLTVVGKRVGVITYTTSNIKSLNEITASYKVEGMIYINALIFLLVKQ